MTAAVTAALYLSIAALAISTIALVIAAKAPTKPVRRRQVQVGGDGSTQLQSAGTLIIPAELSTTGAEVRMNLTDVNDPQDIARKVSAKMGRHL
jgi:hypothetical protein